MNEFLSSKRSIFGHFSLNQCQYMQDRISTLNKNNYFLMILESNQKWTVQSDSRQFFSQWEVSCSRDRPVSVHWFNPGLSPEDCLLLFKPHGMFIWDFTLIFGLGPCQWQMLTTKNVGQPLLDGTKITFTDFRLYRAEYERIIEHLKYRESWRGLTNLNWSKVIWMKNWNLHRNTRTMRFILQTHTVYWLNKRTLTGLLNNTSRSTIEALRLKLNENVSSDEFLFGGMFIWIWNIVIGTEE